MPQVTRPVLVYDRITQNRRKSALLIAIGILLTVPFVAAMSVAVAEVALSQFGPRPHNTAAREKNLRQLMASREAANLDPQLEAQLSIRLQTLREERKKDEAAASSFRWEIIIVVAGGLTALLGLLFWSVAASPTSKILAMCGARPGGSGEMEARRLLENLASSAGLPPPKLYVIDSPTPNAFSAGADPAHSVVAVTQGLLLLLKERELEGVLAHELSHIGNCDTRLNTIVTALALFLRLPYLLIKRKFENYTQNHEYVPVRRSRWYRLLFTVITIPALVYIFVVAPILAALIRSAISRRREFLADADAVLLTRNPEGLLCALAKIGGAGSVLAASNPVISHLYFADPATPGMAKSLFRATLLSTHPSIDKRISRLHEVHAEVPASAIAVAVRDGAEYSRNHKPVEATEAPEAIKHDEISVLTSGNSMGRVFRVLSASPIYDQPDLKSFIVARVPAGGLLVIFDDPGKFRQVLTYDQTFGYLPAAIKLQKVDLLPSEIHDPAARAAAGAPDANPAPYSPTPAEVQTVTIRYIEPIIGRAGENSRSAAVLGARARHSRTAPAPKLTPKQMAFATVLGLAVFAGVFLIMIQLSSK
jgi:heat shock protein HtpX